MTVAVGPEVATRETARLIASDKVEGTAVRRSDGEKLGSIKRVMIDKRTGKVPYAVMTFGGFLRYRRRTRCSAVERAALQHGARRLRAERHGRSAPQCARACDGMGHRRDRPGLGAQHP